MNSRRLPDFTGFTSLLRQNQSLFLADARYREGVDAILVTLDAQRTLYGARRLLVKVPRLRAVNLVELFLALGTASG